MEMEMPKKNKGTVLICPKCGGTVTMYIRYKGAWCSRPGCVDRKGYMQPMVEVEKKPSRKKDDAVGNLGYLKSYPKDEGKEG